jgi:hypothetical protein
MEKKYREPVWDLDSEWPVITGYETHTRTEWDIIDVRARMARKQEERWMWKLYGSLFVLFAIFIAVCLTLAHFAP